MLVWQLGRQLDYLDGLPYDLSFVQQQQYIIYLGSVLAINRLGVFVPVIRPGREAPRALSGWDDCVGCWHAWSNCQSVSSITQHILGCDDVSSWVTDKLAITRLGDFAPEDPSVFGNYGALPTPAYRTCIVTIRREFNAGRAAVGGFVWGQGAHRNQEGEGH